MADANWQTIDVSDGTKMRAYVARPDGKGSVAGIIVLQEAFGVNAHIRSVSERVAALGYMAIAPELFHRTAPGFDGDYGNIEAVRPQMAAMTQAGLEADLRAAYDWLQNDSSVDGSRIAAVGYCMGGRAAYVANSILPLKATVSYYGGRIAPDLLPRAKDQHGPLLFFWGGKDAHIPPEQRGAVMKALDEAGKPYADVVFSDADHGFFCEDRKVYHPASTSQSWALFIAFLRQHLKEKN